jgi:hypothetical protein
MSSIEIDQTNNVSATVALPTEAGLALPAGLGGATPQDIVLRQTDYTIEMAQQKLLEHNNDVIQVIREYMKPQAKQQPTQPKPLSTNQQIYKEIRGMMDDAAATYTNKKQ